MALELQSQAMGALQSVAGVALSLRSYKEHKELKETNKDLNEARAKKFRAQARVKNSIARTMNYTLKREKALDAATDALSARRAEIDTLDIDPTSTDQVGDLLRKLGGTHNVKE